MALTTTKRPSGILANVANLAKFFVWLPDFAWHEFRECVSADRWQSRAEVSFPVSGRSARDPRGGGGARSASRPGLRARFRPRWGIHPPGIDVGDARVFPSEISHMEVPSRSFRAAGNRPLRAGRTRNCHPTRLETPRILRAGSFRPIPVHLGTWRARRSRLGHARQRTAG